MARYLYGGGGDGDVIKTTGVPYINTVALVYNARTGGTIITDLQDAAGAAISQVTTDAYGQAIFYGPDNFIGTLWLDFGVGSGVRWALSPKAVDLAATRAIAVQRAADNAAAAFTTKAHLPYNATDPLEQSLTTALDPLVIPRFPTSSARDSAFPSPVNGDRCYRTDLKADQVYDGAAWQTHMMSDWSSVPTFTITPSSGTFNIGSGSMGIRYRISGKTVSFYLWTSWAADTNYGTGTWVIEGLPFTFSANANNVSHCSGNTFTSAGRFSLFGQLGSGNKITPYAPTSPTSSQLNQIGASPTPGGGSWGATNFIRLSGTTELA